jgi:hypothetical protein
MSRVLFNKTLLAATDFVETDSAAVTVNVGGIDQLSIQPVYTSNAPVAAVMASASNVTAAVQASGIITVIDYTMLAGKTITINGTVYTEGVEWTAAVSNDDTATSIAALTPTGITGTAAMAVATFKNTIYGTVGNAVTLATNAAIGGLTISGALFTGGVDALFTKVDHGFTTGVKTQLTTSNTRPTGTSLLTDYWVIVLDDDTFAIATSLDNALAGTRVQFTSAGVGNQTITPVALSSVVKLQASNDGTNWADISGATVTITTAGTVIWSIANPPYMWIKAVVTMTAGVLNLSILGNAVVVPQTK